MKKRQKDLKKGDIIKVEFGDYGNFVTVVVDNVEDRKIVCHYLDDRPEVMYGDPNDLVDVIGGIYET